MAVVQLDDFGRLTFHRFAPFCLSSPAVNDSLSFSTCATSTPPASTSDDAMPRLLRAFG